MTPVRLEPAALRSRVKHSTTEPLCSLNPIYHFLNDTIILAINIRNTFSPKQVNTLLSINLVDGIFKFPLFFGLSGISAVFQVNLGTPVRESGTIYLSIFTGSLIHEHYTRECEFRNFDKIKNKKHTQKKKHKNFWLNFCLNKECPKLINLSFSIDTAPEKQGGSPARPAGNWVKKPTTSHQSNIFAVMSGRVFLV